MPRTLLIDDDESFRHTLRRALEAGGYQVFEASDGEVIEMQRDQPANVIITDILMPGKDGLETIKVLKREYPCAKIIAITGGGVLKLDYLSMARTLGADLKALVQGLTST